MYPSIQVNCHGRDKCLHPQVSSCIYLSADTLFQTPSPSQQSNQTRDSWKKVELPISTVYSVAFFQSQQTPRRAGCKELLSHARRKRGLIAQKCLVIFCWASWAAIDKEREKRKFTQLTKSPCKKHLWFRKFFLFARIGRIPRQFVFFCATPNYPRQSCLGGGGAAYDKEEAIWILRN